MSLPDQSPFPATSEADWRARILEEHGEGHSGVALEWKPENRLVFDAVATSEWNGLIPSFNPPKGKAWSVLTRLDKLAEEHVMLLDVRDLLPPNLSASQQCAVATAMLADKAESLDRESQVRAIVPVSHRIVLEIAKLMAMRVMLEEILSESAAHALLAGKRHDNAGPTVELYAVAAGGCECPDQETHQIRLTYACLASVLGGADAILPMPFEDADESRRLAKNVLLLLRHESRMAAVQTISNGSYYLEMAASEIIVKGRDFVKRISEAGGYEAAARDGTLGRLLLPLKHTSEHGT